MFLYIFLIAVIIVVICAVLYFLSVGSKKDIQQSQLGSVCIKEKCFSVELAKTNQQREKGLMNRVSLEKDKGMLFIFEKEGTYPFWMKNTLIPLDIIWIGENNTIVFAAESVQPCKTLICPSVVPTVKAKYVLEINSGLITENNFKVGDEVIF